MADKKISELNSLTGANAADGDLVAIVDVSATETKKITRSEFFTSIPSVDINGGTIDGTVIGGSTPAAISGTTITSTGGDLNLDTLDLNAIAASKAVTAVDVFVYDTSKDSDGGAWRKRTQHTSWYNETLNTATRGSRREFPAVAVIVATTTSVTIYDGDDPSLPMWMVFTGGATGRFIPETTYPVSSVFALNGSVSVGQSGIYGGYTNLRFLADVAVRYRALGSANGTQGTSLGPISQRNSVGYNDSETQGALINEDVKDVAMTVLPDAPIDPATGLPVPTIAVATAGGVSVIKDDGAVVDIVFTSNNTVTTVDFDPSNNIWFLHGGNASLAGALKKYAIPDADLTAQSPTSGGLAFYSSVSVPSTSVLPAIYPVTRGIISNKALGANNKLVLLDEDPATKANGMVAYTTSTYNTGWMNGDIKGAFLSDTDDTDLVGSGELVTNGTFDTDTTGWSNTSATIASVSGELQVSNQTDSPSATTQAVSGLVVGKVYAVTATYFQTGTGGTAARVSFFGILSENNSTSTPVTKTIYATATQTTATLSLQSFGTSSTISHFDNVSVQLADADRSVNNKGLIVNGTVTRSPVATGADLVAYSGFSASNYLEQPYNSALDFGTGDFSVMGWVRVTDGVLSRTVLSRRGSNNALQVIFDLSDDKLKLVISNNSFSSSDTVSSNALPISPWVYFCGVRSGSTLLFYQNGSLTGTTAITNATGSLSEADATLEVGHRQDNVIPFTNGSLALLRISATAPTAEQIAKIYNDEKFLFQENAQATLYGASDAVTALAHDDATNLLHVGTSAGRSVFQGLRRVENTTTAVGTAISAANNMIVEQ
jgi:trimeric autotransporter adhesin